MLQDLQWDGCRKETDYYEKSYGSRRNSNFRDTQVDIKDNSWSVEAGLRTCQNNSSSIRYGGKDISFIRKNGHILRGGERMQVKGLFLNYKKNRRLMYKKYQDCGDLEETLMAACDFMERAYEQAPVVDVDSIMRDANEKIVFQLINTEQNKTFLEQVPHREFQDLSIVYKVIISADKDAVQSSKITNEFAKRLGMSEEQLFKCAAENTRRLFPPVVRSMNDIMREMFARDGMPQEIADMMIAEIPPEQTMWVISNENGINGAASMLYENELHELAESLESDLYILPSSVHEVIAVSSDMGSPEMLAQMVVEVNMQEVSLDERLSNQV